MLHQTYRSPFLPRGLPLDRMPSFPNPFAALALPKGQKPVIIDPVAFVLALVLAPLLVACMGFWAMLIPVFAIYLGGPFYLVIGIPLLLWHIPRHGVQPAKIAVLGLKGVLPAIAGVCAFVALTDPRPAWEALPFLAVCSIAMAGLWSLTFAVLYIKLERARWRALNNHINQKPKGN